MSFMQSHQSTQSCIVFLMHANFIYRYIEKDWKTITNNGIRDLASLAVSNSIVRNESLAIMGLPSCSPLKGIISQTD